jgi:hypothetical protein
LNAPSALLYVPSALLYVQKILLNSALAFKNREKLCGLS